MKASLIRMFSPPSSDTRNSADQEECKEDRFNLAYMWHNKEGAQKQYVTRNFKWENSVNNLKTKVIIYKIFAF